MNLFRKLGLASALLAFFISCGGAPTPPDSDGVQVSDENNNTLTTQAVPTNGLKGDYYDNVDFTGTLKTRYDATINKNFASSAPITGIQPTTYSVRWTGQIIPAFSQTYTFYVTSSDGARLMVNGQVLVNDWKDGSSWVRSGTVALQANTKYDIRLDYYRNATNPGTVKLEWQSSSRSKQVVPQASLFTTGSNLQNAFAAIRGTTGFPSSISFDNLNSAGTKLEGTFVINAVEAGGQALYSGLLSPTSAVISLFKTEISNQNVILTDLMSGQVAELGLLTQFKNASGALSVAQKRLISAQLLPMVSRGRLRVIGSTMNSSGIVRPQIFTDPFVPDVPSCFSCSAYADRYRQAAIATADFLAANLIASGLNRAAEVPDLVVKWKDAAISGSDIPSAIFGALPAALSLERLWQEYLDCVEGKFAPGIQGCPVNIRVLPSNVNETMLLNERKTISIEVTNTSPIETVIVNGQEQPGQGSGGLLEYTLDLVKLSSSGSEPFVGIPTFSGYRLSKPYYEALGPTETAQHGLALRCGPTMGTWKGYLGVFHNAKWDSQRNAVAARPIFIDISIICSGTPQISVSPSSLSLVAVLNANATAPLIISNTGDVPLEISKIAITPDQSWITVSKTSLTGADSIAPKTSQTLIVTGYCGPDVTTQPASGSLEITYNASNSGPITIPITLGCVKLIYNPFHVAAGPFSWSGETSNTLIIRNMGNSSFSYSKVTTSGGYGLTSVSDAGGTVAAGGALSLDVRLKCPEILYSQIDASFEVNFYQENSNTPAFVASGTLHCVTPPLAALWTVKDVCGSTQCLEGSWSIYNQNRNGNGSNPVYGVKNWGSWGIAYPDAIAYVLNEIDTTLAASGMSAGESVPCPYAAQYNCRYENWSTAKTLLPLEWRLPWQR